MKTKTKAGISTANERLRKAEREVVAAKAAHRKAFRKACAALFDEYGLYLDANGCEGASLELLELNGRAYRIGDLPE